MLKNTNFIIFLIGLMIVFSIDLIHAYISTAENYNIKNMILSEHVNYDKEKVLYALTERDKHNQVYMALNTTILILLLIIIYYKIKSENKKNILLNRKMEELKNLENALGFSEIISKTDPDGVITHVNDKFCEISGYSKEELIGQTHNIVRHEDMPDKTFKILWSTITNKKVYKGILKNKRKDGTSYHVESTIVPIVNDKNKIVEYIAIRHYVEDMMKHKEVLQGVIKASTNNFLVIVKLEGYDQIEDFYTSELISKLEDRFSEKLLSYFPDECKFDKVYKLDNGEFALIKQLDENEKVTNEKIDLLKKFQNNVKAAKFTIDGYVFNPSVLVSFSTDKDDIFENAKLGLKTLLKQNQTFINANGLVNVSRENAQRNIDTINIIKEAIKENKIVSYYQPIYNNKTKEVEKYESLVRLIKQSGEVLSPYFFLDVAKKSQYYNNITKIVLENNFKILEEIKEDVSINMSFLDIENDETREHIYKLIDNSNQCHRILIELLEDETTKDFNLIQEFIKHVKSKGIKIAIDDFGSGYSNFERLHDFEPNILKIDGSLIKTIHTNPYSRNIVETIQDFATKQNIKTVAEFVDSKEVFDIVNEIGIDYTQGYYISEPKSLS